MFAKGKKRKHRTGPVDTLVGQRTQICGDVTFSGGLHVDGTLRGNVTAEDGADSVLTVSDQGRIEGEVRVANIILNGTIVGDVHAAARIELAPKARVTGDVYYNLIEMAMGAEVNGNLVHRASQEAPDAHQEVAQAPEPRLENT